MFFVVYRVEGFGWQKAGPYESEAEAWRQLKDIIGYEGVDGAYIESARRTEEKL